MNKEKYIKYLNYIAEELLDGSEIEPAYKVIWTPWGADYYYDELNYYEGNYLFDDYVSKKYGVSSGKESLLLWDLFSKKVSKMISNL
jgi:hypothetical protein